MLNLSSRQYALLKHLHNKQRFTDDEAREFNQTTFGSFGKRGYVRQAANGFEVTAVGKSACKEWGADEIYRQTGGRLSVYFKDIMAKAKRA